ncbi:hypothetical protein X975_19647, partial [Stegodyphus mimosarum]
MAYQEMLKEVLVLQEMMSSTKDFLEGRDLTDEDIDFVKEKLSVASAAIHLINYNLKDDKGDSKDSIQIDEFSENEDEWGDQIDNIDDVIKVCDDVERDCQSEDPKSTPEVKNDDFERVISENGENILNENNLKLPVV